MTKFITGGSTRYRHQRRGLRKLIETGGNAALLFDPGLGKTATALDYASLLALKLPSGEARVLVACPLAAVDTWVMQARIYVSPQVHFWAEALGGSIQQRCEALRARGPLGRKSEIQTQRRSSEPVDVTRSDSLRGSPGGSLGQQAGPITPGQPCLPRSSALHHQRSLAWSSSDPISPALGPEALPTPRLILEVINLDTLSSRQQVGSRTMADVVLKAVEDFSPDLLILDESHKAKSPSSNTSRLLHRISKKVPRRILLTGTVIPHSPLDVYAQWRLIDPRAFGPVNPDGSRRMATYSWFKQRYAVMGGYLGREVLGFQNLDHMQQIMAERSLVATKDDALDLPETTDAVVPVTLDDKERTAYEQMRSDMLVQLDGGELASAKNRLVSMVRLRQITSGFLPADDEDPHQPRVLGTSKIDVICDLVRSSLVGEQRIVIFCSFRAEIASLAERLASRDTQVEVITGDTPTRERAEIRQRFGDTGEHPERIVLIAQVRTISLAINELVSASHAIFGSLSWQRDDLVQARDRLHRIGQTRPVTFHWVLAEKSIDEVIHRTYLDRSNLEAAVLEHIKEGTP